MYKLSAGSQDITSPTHGGRTSPTYFDARRQHSVTIRNANIGLATIGFIYTLFAGLSLPPDNHLRNCYLLTYLLISLFKNETMSVAVGVFEFGFETILHCKRLTI